MAVLPIQCYPAEVLTRRCDEVSVFDEKLSALARDMVDTMYAAPGVGLAAPQVAVSQRLIVVDCAGNDEEPQLIIAVNPVIVARAGECCEEEGCLSVPGYNASVKRSAWVQVKYQDLHGALVECEAEGLLAVCFQHEIDHLDGKLFVDRLSSLKRGMFRKKYKKILQEQQESS